MQKLVFGLLLLLASLRTGADDLCMTVTSDPASQPPERDLEKIVAPAPAYPGNDVPEGSEGFVDVRFDVTAAGNVSDPVVVRMKTTFRGVAPSSRGSVRSWAQAGVESATASARSSIPNSKRREKTRMSMGLSVLVEMRSNLQRWRVRCQLSCCVFRI